MRKLTGLTVWGATAALVCALGVVPLSACSSPDDAAEPAAEEQPADEAAEQEAEEAPEEDQADEAVWVRVSESFHSEGYDMGEQDDSFTYEVDEAGNYTSVAYGGEPTGTTYEYDENGWMVSSANGDAVTTYENEYDDEGRLVSQKSEGMTVTYVYDENGNIASQTNVVVTFDQDENGEMIEGSESTQTITSEYDESGFVLRRTSGGTNGTHTTEYTYTYDEAGVPTECAVHQYFTDSEGAISEDTDMTSTRTLTFDENGNLTKVETDDGDLGSQSDEFSYVLVEHPSLAVRINAHIKPL